MSSSSSLIPVLPVPLLAPSTTPSPPPPPMATTTTADAVAKMVSGAHAAADEAAAALAFRPSISYPSLDVYADGTIKQRWSGKTLERTKRAGRWYVFTRDLTEEGDAVAAAASAVGGAPPPPATKLVDRIICEAWNGPHSTLLHSHMGHVTYLDDNRENLTPANLVWCTIEAHAAMQQRGKKKRECKAAAVAAAAAAARADMATAVAASPPSRSMHLPPPQHASSFDGTTMASAIQSFYDDWSVPGSQQQQQQQTDDENDDDAGEPAAKRRKASDTDDDGEDVPILVHPTAAAATAPPTPAFRPQQVHAHAPRRAAPVFRYANPDMSDAVFQMDAQRPKVIVGAFHSLNDAVQAMSARLKRDYVEVGNALLLVLNQPLCQLGGFSWVTPSRLVELHCPPRLATAAAPPTPAFRPAAHPTSTAAAAAAAQ